MSQGPNNFLNKKGKNKNKLYKVYLSNRRRKKKKKPIFPSSNMETKNEISKQRNRL